MAISRRARLTLALLVLSPLFLVVVQGGGGEAEAVPIPVVASSNVELLENIPGSAAISGEFARSAPYFYTSGLDSISVFDVSDPRKPVLKGKLASLQFENEAMTYGERKAADGTVTRFVLVGVDLYQAGLDTAAPARGNAQGKEVVVVDVTDPTNPHIRSRTPQGSPLRGSTTTSTHTVQCLTVACPYAYTAGSAGRFSIIDLTDLDAPKQVKEAPSPAAGPSAAFAKGAGHYWDIDESGTAWHTGSGGAAAFDVSDPLNPQLLNATDPQGSKGPYNDFILHNSMRPNARAFTPGAPPSVANGNVALVTEEDYANDGDEVVCDRAGTFQTWEIPDLDGAAHRAANPDNAPGKGTITPLAQLQAPSGEGGGLSTPVGGFCSAHWFDYHQSGIVAQGWYQQGLRLIDVRDARKPRQIGYFTAGASEVWDAYWVPRRDASGGVAPDAAKTNIVYTADLVRGLDVLEVKDLPPPVVPNAGG